jgi:hypothetical protein
MAWHIITLAIALESFLLQSSWLIYLHAACRHLLEERAGIGRHLLRSLLDSTLAWEQEGDSNDHAKIFCAVGDCGLAVLK